MLALPPRGMPLDMFLLLKNTTESLNSPLQLQYPPQTSKSGVSPVHASAAPIRCTLLLRVLAPAGDAGSCGMWRP